MQEYGFLRDMLDVKILILYVLSRVETPADMQQVYELCFQEDLLSYFDVCEALPQMVTSGHLKQEGNGYVITDKGRETGELTADSILYSVRRRAEEATVKFNRRMRRSKMIDCTVETLSADECYVTAVLHDDKGEMMKLSLVAPDEGQAIRLKKRMEQKADLVYSLVMTALLDDDLGD